MPRRRNREDWRRAVMRDPRITDATRVLLLVMFDYVRTDMTVSVPRRDLADMLQRSERRIAERVQNAQEAGLLGKDPIVRGRKGRTAVYACLFPDVQGDGLQHPMDDTKGARNRHPKNALSVTPGGHTSSKRPPESSMLNRLPNGGNEEDAWIETTAHVHRHAVPGWDREESA